MNLMSAFRKRTPSGQPIEVGTVSWLRELEEAMAISDETGRPVFALFQEVPGCAGCKQFGAEVLSNQVIVDAIEEAFVPLLIHNNTGGRDAEVLAQYGEPAWNFQVVRFLDSDGFDIIERRDKVWETGPLAARMVQTLEKAGREIPPYLRLVEQEFSDRLETIHFAQGCFWTGEMHLAQIEGVVYTLAGFMGGHEITTVYFDPNQINAGDVAREAKARGVASIIYAEGDVKQSLERSGFQVQFTDEATHRVAPKRDQKRQISGVPGLKGLTPAQTAKVNGFFRSSAADAAKYLAPSQRGMLGRV